METCNKWNSILVKSNSKEGDLLTNYNLFGNLFDITEHVQHLPFEGNSL